MAMRPPRPPRLRACAAAAVSLSSLALAGCSSDVASGAAWAFAGLAMLGVGALAFALGHARALASQRQALRSAREEVRVQQALGQGSRWETDARHRLLRWQSPGAPELSACPLFERGDAGLLGRLRTMQAFDGVVVELQQPFEQHRRWRLRAAPRHDDLGSFAGYCGQAEPLPEATPGGLDPQALQPLLGAHPQALVVASREADGRWLAQLGNPPARVLWKGLDWPCDLDNLLPELPPAAVQALRNAMDDATGPQQAAGWRVEAFRAADGAACGLVLSQLPPDAPAASESDQFTFTASHDLRAPIRVVEGFTRIVKEDYGHLLDRVGNDHLDRVLGAAARMNLMIDALLQLARLSQQPLARQPVNLSQLAGFIADELARTAPERQAEFAIEPDLGATGDATLLRLVLENLLSNAWKYSAKVERTRIEFCTVPHEQGLAYCVRDNGAGFDMRGADRLFGLFQRLHSASDFPGHGVGLASVRRIVQRHGGEIWAESEPGQGAAFYFTLGG